MVYNYNQDQTASSTNVGNQYSVGSQFVQIQTNNLNSQAQSSLPPISIQDKRAKRIEFGARTKSWPEQRPTNADRLTLIESPPNYNFGLALKQFNPPLYHPEVHETKPDEVSEQNGKPVVYSSTIVHSELAAELNYKPERVSALNSQNGPQSIADDLQGEILQRISSEKYQQH